jgi:hypothetical protein
MNPLNDGTYDVIVVEAEDQADGTIALQLAISSGARRGEVIALRAAGLHVDGLDLLALPATLTVTDGEPALKL